MYDLSKFCHICFNTNKKLDNFDSSDEEILENLRYIGYETDWLITETPIKICSDCFFMLNITTYFKQMCIKNNQCLKKYIVQLKRDGQNDRVDLHVYLKHAEILRIKRNRRKLKAVKLGKRKMPSRAVKHLKPIRSLVLDCRVQLERICVVSELQKLGNGGRNCAPKLTNHVQESSDELFTEAKREKLSNVERILYVGNVVDENISGMYSEMGGNSTLVKLNEFLAPEQVRIAENVIENASLEEAKSENSDILKRNPPTMERSTSSTGLNRLVASTEVPNRIGSAKKNVQVDLDDLFPNSEDEKLKDIIKSLMRISKMSKQNTKPQMNKAIQFKKKSDIPESVLLLINKLTTEFNSIFKTLVTYGNNTIDTFYPKNLSENRQHSENNLNVPHNRQFTTMSEEIYAQLAEEYSITPQTPTYAYNNNQKVTDTHAVNKHKSLLAHQSSLNSHSIPPYSHLPTQLNNSNLEQQTYLPNSTNYNSNYPTHSTPNLNFNVFNNTDTDHNYNDSEFEEITTNITPLKSDANIIATIDAVATNLPDYDSVITQNSTPNSNDSAYLPDASTLQLQNFGIANELLLSCEVLLEDGDDRESRVLTEKCVLCEVAINSNSNYCQACFARLNTNLRQSNRRECINCCQPLEADACSSLFCVECSKISTLTSLNKGNVFGKLYSHCVVCCKIFKNQSGEIRPNFVCKPCGPLDKLCNLKLFDCDLCQYRFLDNFKYVAHQKEHELKEHECPVCLKRYSIKKSLQSHFNYHSRTNVYKCSICAREYSKKYPFRMHMKLHAGIKDVKCNHCDQMFVIHKQLYWHMKQKHPDCISSKQKKLVDN